MSVRVIAMVFEAGPEDLAQHSVMMALADNADDFGVAWPGHELLARKSRMCVRNAIRVLDALERDGWLVKRKRMQGEHRRGNVYEMNLARLRSVDAASTAPRETKRSTRAVAGNLSRRDTRSLQATSHEENAAACESPSDTVSPIAKTDGGDMTSAQREVTSSAPRSDMGLAELLLHQRDAKQNRHEPSIEPSSTPLPPLQGGALRAVLDASRESKSESPTEAERVELAEVNVIRARRGDRAVSWEQYATWRAVPIANPADPRPVRSARKRWRNRQQ